MTAGLADYRPIASAPRDASMIEVLVPSADGGFIAGRAYFDAAAYDGTWWWEGTERGGYGDDPIEECNHGAPLYWRPAAAPGAVCFIGALVARACHAELTSLDGIINVDGPDERGTTVLAFRNQGKVAHFRVIIDHATVAA